MLKDTTRHGNCCPNVIDLVLQHIEYFLQLLTSVFLDEWNMLMRTKVTAGMIIKFELFGAMQEIRLKDQGVASVDIYASIGGKYVFFFAKFCV